MGLPFYLGLLRRMFSLPYAYYVVVFDSSEFAFVFVFCFFLFLFILLFLSLLCPFLATMAFAGYLLARFIVNTLSPEGRSRVLRRCYKERIINR